MDPKKIGAQFGDILKPLKAVIHGVPASGRTTIAKRICRRYGAHYVSVRTMIDETLEELTQNIRTMKDRTLIKTERTKDVPDEEAEEEEEEEGENVGYDAEMEAYEEQLRDIYMLMNQNVDRKLPDEYVVRLMRIFLAKDICQSHGYILDGFPKTILQAKELFGQAAEVPKDPGEAQGEEVRGEGDVGEGGIAKMGEIAGNASINIMPDFVISLQADDDFLCERIMKLPEREIRGTHYDEQNMIRRLVEYRTNNTANNTVLNFFDEAEIHPIVIDVMDEITKDTDDILSYLYSIFGPPIPGFGLTDEEEEELRKMELEERKLKQQAYLLEKQLAEEAAKKEYEDKMEKWAETLEKLQMEEEKIIASESEPLRFYLMKYVFPTLTKGLSEVAKIKPDDPVDYLAEFLFKENPEGKMFDPSFTRSGEEILKQHEMVAQSNPEKKE